MTPAKLPMEAEKLIKHRPPMLLISELIARDGDTAAATAHLSTDSICLSHNNGTLPEYFIEIIAQTMAAANGYDNLLENRDPRDGFIVGLDNFSLQAHYSDAEDFIIRIEKTMEFGSMKVLTGEVSSGNRLIATAELKVWEQEESE